MKTALLVLLCVGLSNVPLVGAQEVVSVGSSGPFAGVIAQGASQTHRFDNNPLNQPCLQMMTTYSVVLEYVPTSDTLTLTADGFSSTGHGGFASITLTRSVCTEFGIVVSGTAVALRAAYTVTVTGGSSSGAVAA